MGLSRKIKRTEARAMYDRFSKIWRRDVRLAGLYGKPNAPKRPSFQQWYAMHQADVSQMEQSTPADVAEHLADPWAEQLMEHGMGHDVVNDTEIVQRGVETINIAGDDDE